MLLQDLLYRGAEQTPDNIALHWIDRARKLTFAQVVGEMERVAGLLKSLEVEHGDRVGILAHNGLDYVTAMFGAWRLGAAAATINVQQADRLDEYINDSNPKVLIYTHDKYQTIERCRPQMPSIKHYICMDGAQPGALDWAELLHNATAPPPDPTQDSDLAYIWYKPGANGVMDRATLTHASAFQTAHNISAQLQLRHTDVTLGPTTLSNSFHLVANLLAGLHGTATVGIMTRWEAHAAWQVLEDTGVSVVVADAAHLQDILDVSREKGRPPARLRVALSNSQSMSPELKTGWQKELKSQVLER